MERPQITAAVPTPFRADGTIDLNTASVLLARLAERVDAIFLCGTNGEFMALDEGERIALAECALDVLPAARVVVHVGAASTWQTVRLIHRMQRLRVTRFAAITPMIHSVGPDSVIDHYRRIRDAIGEGELYAYVYREISGNTLTPEEYRGLTGIVDGIKASGSLTGGLDGYVRARPDAAAWTGDDSALPSAYAQGAAGTVSGCASVLPDAWRDLATAIESGTGVERAQARVSRIAATVGRSIAHVRSGLAATGIDPGPARMTFDPVTDAERESIRRLVEEEVGSSAPI